nr:hypothetical protein [Tanacetum cinerariifolium]
MVSEGFNRIIDFLNGSYIKHALTINPHIYVSYIKQFWNTIVVKQSNDVTRLQDLVDKKKVVITEATIRDGLRLDDAEGVDYLLNDEIFTELTCMGYKKPSTKLTFYKAFFSIQWKFLIHNILQSLSSNYTSWNEFSSAMASAVICLSTGEIQEQGDAEEQVQDDIDDAAAQGADTAIEGDDEALDAYAALARCIENLEYDKVAQALEITKLKRRVKKLERGNNAKVLNLKRLKKGRMIDELDRDEGVALIDDVGAEKKAEEAQFAGDDHVKGRQAEIYKIDMDHASKVLSMQEDKPKVQEVVDVVSTTKLITEVVTAASTTIVAVEPQVPSATITAAPVRVVAASTRRRKRVVIRDP